MKSTLHLLILAAVSFRAAAQVSTCSVIDAADACPAGCWHDPNQHEPIDGVHTCLPVGTGYFSPMDNNNRAPCAIGSYSDEETAESCSICPEGSHGPRPASDKCVLCPPGTYSDVPGSFTCIACLHEHNILVAGSVGVTLVDGTLYCIPPATAEPTQSPTAAPTPAPVTPAPVVPMPTPAPATSAPVMNQTPSPTPITPAPTTSMPSSIPSQAPTIQPESYPSDAPAPSAPPSHIQEAESRVCEFDEFQRHWQCNQCPSVVEQVLQIVWLVLFCCALMLVFSKLSELCHSALWMGFDFLQMIYLIVSIPVPGKSSAVMSVLRKILSVIFLDLTSVFSLQCLLGLPPVFDQAITTLIIPMFCIATAFAFTGKVGIPIKHLTIVFFLGNANLMMTAIEGLHCMEDNTVFCHEKKAGFVISVIGLVFHGGCFLAWLMYALSAARSIPDDKDDSSAAGWTWAQVFPFHEECWWWSGYILVRKWLVTIVVLVSPFVPKAVVFTLMLVAFGDTILQQFTHPIPQDAEGNTSRFKNQTLDDVFKVIFVIILAFIIGRLHLGDDGDEREDVKGALPLAIMILILLIVSVIVWVMTVVKNHLGGSTHPRRGATFDDDEESADRRFDPENVSVAGMRSIRDNEPYDTGMGLDRNLSLMPVLNNDDPTGDDEYDYEYDDATIESEGPDPNAHQGQWVAPAPSHDVSELTEAHTQYSTGQYGGEYDEYPEEDDQQYEIRVLVESRYPPEGLIG